MGEKYQNIEYGDYSLVTLDAGEHVILAASLNSGVLIGNSHDFSFTGYIKYYGSRSRNYIAINDYGHVFPDIFPDTASVLVSVSVSNIFFNNEDYLENKNVLKIVDVRAWDSNNTEVIS